MGKRGHSALKGYSFKEISKVLAEEGFFPHHSNSAHTVFANEERYYVTVPSNNKKEINHVMSTLQLQRIRNGTYRRMTEKEYKEQQGKFKQ